ALGTMSGREEIRAWIWKTMTAFPGSHMTGYPSLWHVVDAPTGRVICEVDNPMRDPGDGTLITATNITILTYAGNGLWSREEDVYNPMEFGQAAMRWCEKSAELGTLDDDAARWMETIGVMFARRR
ncbi:nuclear transport factor 2 family protein, partial [Streptomyces sp. SID10244]|nr:nuclear transport factor 2 family protein [Streptomyces sp. SID10244]